MRVKWLFLTLNTIRAKFLFESLSYNINNIITHLFMHFILFFCLSIWKIHLLSQLSLTILSYVFFWNVCGNVIIVCYSWKNILVASLLSFAGLFHVNFFKSLLSWKWRKCLFPLFVHFNMDVPCFITSTHCWGVGSSFPLLIFFCCNPANPEQQNNN